MLTKRIIPCLDIHEGRTVKGVNFVALRDAGDPVELAKRYVLEGADELVFLDITATSEQRSTLTCLVRKVAEQLSIPFSVGGGVRTADDAAALLDAGADKVCINSGAVRNPRCISELSSRFGSQCVVLACDGKLIDGEWRVVVAGGREITPLRVHDWLQEGAERGAGEVLLTSMEHDGTKGGFACELTAEVSERLKIPVIASGGAGAPQHFAEVFEKGRADGALAASVFHFGEIRIPELKMYLKRAGHAVRTVVDTSNALQEVQ